MVNPFWSDPKHLKYQSINRFRRGVPTQPIVIVDLLDKSTIDEVIAQRLAEKHAALMPFVQSTGSDLLPEFKQERQNLPPRLGVDS